MTWHVFVAVVVGTIIAGTLILNIPTEPCPTPDWGNTEFFDEEMKAYYSLEK